MAAENLQADAAVAMPLPDCAVVRPGVKNIKEAARRRGGGGGGGRLGLPFQPTGAHAQDFPPMALELLKDEAPAPLHSNLDTLYSEIHETHVERFRLQADEEASDPVPATHHGDALAYNPNTILVTIILVKRREVPLSNRAVV